MSNLYPVVFLIAIAGTWFLTAWQNHKLYRAFLAKYPKEAEKFVPFASSKTRHPEKVIFFFRRTSLPILKADSTLWKQRQRLKLLLIFSVLPPFACLVLLALRAVAEAR